MRLTSTLSLAIAMALTMSATAQLSTYSALGDAEALGGGCITLTSSNATTGGGAWANERIDLAQPFHIQATVNFGSIDGGSEGVIWALQAETPGVNTASYTDLGPSFGVEFDTRSQAENGDLAHDHIAMVNHGSLNHMGNPTSHTAGPVAAFVSGAPLTDGNDHLVDIVWDPAGPELRVHLDCAERLVASIDLMDDIFDGERFVHWGFTSESDGALNAPRVCLTENATGTDTEIHACPEAAVQLVAGGLDVTEYAWSPSNVVSDPTLQAPIYTGVVSNTLTVTYTNQCGLSITDEVEVVVEEVEVELASDGNALNCTNNGVLHCAAISDFGSSLEYTWKLNNSVVGQGMTYDMTSPGNLSLEVVSPETSSLLCADAQSMTVSVDTLRLSADAGLPGTLTCDNPSLELLGSATDSPYAEVQWTTLDGGFDGATDGLIAHATSAGTYTLTVTNRNNGCVSTDAVVMAEDTEMPELQLGYVAGTLDCDNDEVDMVGNTLSSTEHTAMFAWTDAQNGDIASTELNPTFQSSGVYNVEVTFLENGCKTSIDYAADVQSDIDVLDLSQMVLPNVMTPDGNGRNDRFMPFVPGHEDQNVFTMMDAYDIQVYNRWGDLLFENNGMPVQWDGRSNGTLVDNGTYIVSISYEASCGGLQYGELQTTLQVIR